MNYIEIIKPVEPYRSTKNAFRRFLKLVEEIGEIADAYLVSTSSNSKNKKIRTFDDVREEIIDAFIVSIDLYLIYHTDEYQPVPTYTTFEEKYVTLTAMAGLAPAAFMANKDMKDSVKKMYEAAFDLLMEPVDSTDNTVNMTKINEVFNNKINKWKGYATNTDDALEAYKTVGNQSSSPSIDKEV